MREDHLSLRIFAPEAQAPYLARTARQPCASIQSEVKPYGDGWRTGRCFGVGTVLAPQRNGAPDTITSSRRPATRCSTPRTAKPATTPRQGSVSWQRCRHCLLTFTPGELFDHTLRCSSKRTVCKQIEPRTNVASKYAGEGGVLNKPKAQLTVKQQSGNPPQKSSKTKNSSGNRDKCKSHAVLHSKKPSTYCHCGAVLLQGTDVAKHKQVCPEEEVPCPLMCGKVLRRGDVAQHVKEQALLHDPQPIPDTTNCAADDPKVLLILVMNMLLERADAAHGSIPLTQTNDMSLMSESAIEMPHKTAPSPYPQSRGCVERRSPFLFTKRSAFSTTETTQLSHPAQAAVESGQSQCLVVRIPSSMPPTPEPQWNIPDPIARDKQLTRHDLTL